MLMKPYQIDTEPQNLPREESAGVILDTVGPGGQVGGGQPVRDGVERGEADHALRSQGQATVTGAALLTLTEEGPTIIFNSS